MTSCCRFGRLSDSSLGYFSHVLGDCLLKHLATRHGTSNGAALQPDADWQLGRRAPVIDLDRRQRARHDRNAESQYVDPPQTGAAILLTQPRSKVRVPVYDARICRSVYRKMTTKSSISINMCCEPLSNQTLNLIRTPTLTIGYCCTVVVLLMLGNGLDNIPSWFFS